MNLCITTSQIKLTNPIPMNNTDIIAFNQVVSLKPGKASGNSSGINAGAIKPEAINDIAIKIAIISVLNFSKRRGKLNVHFISSILGCSTPILSFYD